MLQCLGQLSLQFVIIANTVYTNPNNNIIGIMASSMAKTSDHRLQSKILFETNQITRIQKRFNQFAENGKMDAQTFKRSMGLLGIGECEFLCDRIFPIITEYDSFDFDEFLSFLNTITYGSRLRKAKISFDFLDKGRKGYINYNDVELVISEISFIWNFLTGQKISNTDSIALICDLLDIREDRSISFEQYMEVYDNYIEWYDYFNSQIKVRGVKKHVFNVDQVQEYLKMLYGEIQNMIEDLRESDDTQEETLMINSFSQVSEINSVKGPIHMSFQEPKPKGDFDNPRESMTYYRASTLSREIVVQGSSKLQVVTKKLEQFQKISTNLFPQYQSQQQGQLKWTGRGKKKALINKTQPDKVRKKIVYFGHENWNIMLNMMLGIRKSLKSHFYKFDTKVDFSEEDLNCKYSYQLIYKQNNKSVKEISQIFVDYSPKVFFYIRCYFQIENHHFLKSIGLENLIGNLLMGNLTSLTDQTSEGKGGSFFYYTEDTKLIVRSILKEEYKKLRELLADYAEYVRDNPGTFLLHIYGLYKLKNKQTNRQIYFVVVNNFFETSLQIEERYDIKGSTHNRQSKTHGPNTALKELDLMNNKQRSFPIESTTKQKYRIYKQIVKDSQFLSSHNITDYSLLVGISKSMGETADYSNKGFRSIDHNETFFFGIIDILTDYSVKKVLENHFRHIFQPDISCLAPKDYNDRFNDFIYKHIFGW